MFHGNLDRDTTVLIISEEETMKMDIQENHETSAYSQLRIISIQEFNEIVFSDSEITLIMIDVLAILGQNKAILNTIRKEKPSVPLILLSRHLCPETLKLAAIYHFQEVIQLPVKHETIQTLINKYVKK
ncbi:MAG: hypothetical protein KKA81_04555 [Bacteroidetes bacterium]|nr:hypothetical protein [Bacteroidota bacterium]